MAAVSNLAFVNLKQEILEIDKQRLVNNLLSLLEEAKKYKRLKAKVNKLFALQDAIIKQQDELNDKGN